MVKKFLQIVIMSVLTLSFLAGCSKGEPENPTETPKFSEYKFPDEPLTIRMFQSSANISDSEFKDLIADPVKQKFPNVTMEIVRPSAATNKESMISSGDFPDMIYTNTTVIQEFVDLKLPLDLNPLMKKYNFDTTRFNQRFLDDIRAYADKGQLYGVPFSTNFDVLYYNKDIFDKFGVAYPKDGMTWDEVIQLGKQLTREEGGIKYQGLYPTLMKYFATQLSVPFVNPQTLRAELTTDGWKRVFETYKAIADSSNSTDPGNSLVLFNRSRTLAMMAHYGARVGELEQFRREGNPINWDMVTYPTFKDKPGLSQGADTHYMMISSLSKNAEAAFQILNYLASDESQIRNSSRGRLSALKDPKIRENFGSEIESLKGKNIQAIFKSIPAPLPKPTIYDGLVKEPNLQKFANEYLKGTADVNTILKQLEDTVNKDIEAKKQSSTPGK